MSDLLLQPEHAREPLQEAFSDAANPIALDGVEFIEYATSQPQALGQVLEMMGFPPGGAPPLARGAAVPARRTEHHRQCQSARRLSRDPRRRCAGDRRHLPARAR